MADNGITKHQIQQIIPSVTKKDFQLHYEKLLLYRISKQAMMQLFDLCLKELKWVAV